MQSALVDSVIPEGKPGGHRRNIAVTASIVGLLVVNQNAFAQADKPKIIHDAEYYVLDAQHGEKWAVEDTIRLRVIAPGLSQGTIEPGKASGSLQKLASNAQTE